MTTPVYLSLGGNLGDRAACLRQAALTLSNHPKIQLIQASCLYETEPVGMIAQEPAPWFLNAVLFLETELTPADLLAVCQNLEIQAGRQPAQRKPFHQGCESRPLDVDIVFFGDQVIREAGLIIPHPRLHERAFVLVPMLEVAPHWEHPLLQKTIQQLHWELIDPEEVRIFDAL